ncbi:MAG: hypothetical protein CR993_02475 [Rhodobacterales bacterium]|nr:MAG: hypothetical protein CR993_02475 [Rhodobacterales bacterium]
MAWFKPLRLALAALLLASPAAAADTPAVTCLFTTECVEQEPCADTDFSLHINLVEQEIDTGWGALQIGVTKFMNDATVLFADDGGANYMLTRNGAASALSVHTTDLSVITYFGTCEGDF